MKSRSGFTIVELLIVIVVIGILAALVISAYRNAQDRALIAKSQTEIKDVHKAIQLYFAEKGSYPSTSSSWRTSNDNPSDYVPGLAPTYIPQLPVSSVGTTGGTGSYMYRSDGSNYKIIAHAGKYTEWCPRVKAEYSNLIDPIRDCWAYGYWSSGGSGL